MRPPLVFLMIFLVCSPAQHIHKMGETPRASQVDRRIKIAMKLLSALFAFSMVVLMVPGCTRRRVRGKSAKLKHTALPSDSIGERERVACPQCGKQMATWGGIRRHLRLTHGTAIIAVDKKAQMEQRKRYHANRIVKLMTKAEFDTISYCPTSDKHFLCRLCNNKRFSVRSATRHLSKKHKIGEDVHRKWFVMHDCSIAKNKGKTFKLKAMIQKYTSDSEFDNLRTDSAASSGISQMSVAGPPNAATGNEQVQKACGPLATSVSEALAEVRQLAPSPFKAQGFEVLLPADVNLSVIVTTWAHPDKGQMRHQCPLAKDTPALDMQYDEFQKYLCLRNLETYTVRETIMNVSRFFDLFDWGGQPTTALGLLLNIYTSKLIPRLMECDVMSRRYGWSRRILDAVSHYCQFLAIECARCRHTECKTALEAMVEYDLELYRRQARSEARWAKKDRNRIDAERIQNLPSNEIMRDIVLQAMTDLWKTCKRMPDSTEDGARSKMMANTCVVGIIFLNGFAGRGGEWETMLKSHVETQLLNRHDFFVCPDHKTSYRYGDLAKWIAPGTMRAIELYLTLHSGKSIYAFEHPTDPTKKITVSWYMQRFADIYCQKYQTPTVSLLRKQFHTVLLQKSREDACLALLSKLDAHSKTTARNIYCTTTPENDAQLGKILFSEMRGEPVAWPSDEFLFDKSRDEKRIHALQKELDDDRDDCIVTAETSSEDSCVVHEEDLPNVGPPEPRARFDSAFDQGGSDGLTRSDEVTRIPGRAVTDEPTSEPPKTRSRKRWSALLLCHPQTQ